MTTLQTLQIAHSYLSELQHRYMHGANQEYIDNLNNFRAELQNKIEQTKQKENPTNLLNLRLFLAKKFIH